MTSEHELQLQAFIPLVVQVLWLLALRWRPSQAAWATICTTAFFNSDFAEVAVYVWGTLLLSLAFHEGAHIWAHRRRHEDDGTLVLSMGGAGIRVSEGVARSRRVALAGPIAGLIVCWTVLALSPFAGLTVASIVFGLAHLSSLLPFCADGSVIWN